jgi:hypothetical protein
MKTIKILTLCLCTFKTTVRDPRVTTLLSNYVHKALLHTQLSVGEANNSS